MGLPHLLGVVIIRSGVVDGVMQTSALFALQGLTGDQITDVDHVSQLADVLAGFALLEQLLCFFIEQIKSVPCTP